MDLTGSSNVNLLQMLLPWSGALLAPVVGTIATVLSRSISQRKQQEYEYKIKRLEVIEKALLVGKSMSNELGVDINASVLQSEYFAVLNSLKEPGPPSEKDVLPFERRSLPLRLLLVPWPKSVSGWIASTLFYSYLWVAVANPIISFQVINNTGYRINQLATRAEWLNALAVENETHALQLQAELAHASEAQKSQADHILELAQEAQFSQENSLAGLQKVRAAANKRSITIACFSTLLALIFATIARYWAISAARSAIRCEREAYQRDHPV